MGYTEALRWQMEMWNHCAKAGQEFEPTDPDAQAAFETLIRNRSREVINAGDVVQRQFYICHTESMSGKVETFGLVEEVSLAMYGAQKVAA